VLDVRQIDFLLEIEEILRDHRPRWHWLANICTTSPLKLDKLAAERYVHMLKNRSLSGQAGGDARQRRETCR